MALPAAKAPRKRTSETATKADQGFSWILLARTVLLGKEGASKPRKRTSKTAKKADQGFSWLLLARTVLLGKGGTSKRRKRTSDQEIPWSFLTSTVMLGMLLVTLYFFFEIYAPTLLFPFLVIAGLLSGDKAVIWGLGGLAVTWGIARLVLRLARLAPVFEKLGEKLSQRPVALVLAVVTAVAALWTFWDRQQNDSCPILRIEPMGTLRYFLQDKDADKPSERTFEIVVNWKTEHRSFYPPDEGTLDIGAWESALVWRASRPSREGAQKAEDRANEPPRHYLGTDRFQTGDVIRISLFCQNPRKKLFSVEEHIAPNQKLLKHVPFRPTDDGVFAEEMLACEPRS